MKKTVIITATGEQGSGKTLTLGVLKRVLSALGVEHEENRNRDQLAIKLTDEDRRALGDIEKLLPALRN